MAAAVRRRRVLMVSGFDPRGPAHTHRLYAEEGARQAAVSGYRLDVGPREGAAWQVRMTQDGEVTETHVECLRWDDIVRAHWPRGAWGALRATVQASWALWRSGILWRTLKTSWPAALAMGLPSLALLAVVTVCALAAVSPWAALPAVVALALVAWRLGPAGFVPWLMRSVALQFRFGSGRVPELEARVDAFAARVGRELDAGGHDELLLVGHSCGALWAMAAAARALEARPQARLSLLTLGHGTQILSQQPKAQRFRDDLLRLAQAPGLSWVDVTAPPDACCLALVSPTWHAGATLSQAPVPTLLNARFANLFPAPAYAGLKRDKYRCHFQYLMAGAIPGGWDWFATSAGRMPLAQRHPPATSVTGFKGLQCLGGPDPSW